MRHSTARGRARFPAQHRLGTPGLVYCREYPEIDRALTTGRYGLLGPVWRSWAGLRRQAVNLRQALSVG